MAEYIVKINSSGKIRFVHITDCDTRENAAAIARVLYKKKVPPKVLDVYKLEERDVS